MSPNYIIRIIMPCGGVASDVDVSSKSILDTASCLDFAKFIVYRVFNNGLVPSSCVVETAGAVTFVDLDMNPTASVAGARNLALDEIASQMEPSVADKDTVVFLDSGDLLLPDLIRSLPECLSDIDMLVGRTVVSSGAAKYKRGNAPLSLKHVVNPIYLGSAVIKTSVAVSQRFIDGRQEDWKFWLGILANKVKIRRSRECNYVYTVKSRSDHARRKSHLLGHQFAFYRDHLRFGLSHSILLMFCHYVLISVIWGLVLPLSRIKASPDTK